MKIEIKHRYTGSVLFAHDAEENSLKITLAMAIKSGADFTGANFTDADFTGANFYRADFTGANFTDADFTDADFTDADFTGADFYRADFYRADFTGADFYRADLTVIRDDIWAVLSSAPLEVEGLISALKNGLVDGSTYTGECACLVGTLAHVKNVNYNNIDSLKPNSSRPAERFFLGIKQGDIPETNQFSVRKSEDHCWTKSFY